MNFPDGLERLELIDTKITSLDNVRFPDGLSLFLNRTPLAKDPAKLQALKDKYPNIQVYV